MKQQIAEAKNEFQPLFGITSNDLGYFKTLGKSSEQVFHELDALSTNAQYPTVKAPALFSNGGIKILSETDLTELNQSFNNSISSEEYIQTIPAAGAATRQTQLLKTLLNHEAFRQANTFSVIRNIAHSAIFNLTSTPVTNDAIAADIKLLQEVLNNIGRFWQLGIVEKRYAFYQDLSQAMKSAGHDLENSIKIEDIKLIARFILGVEGLNYGFLPKLLMKTHSYQSEASQSQSRTSLEEHIREFSQLMAGQEQLRLHFIISKEHQDATDVALDQLWENSEFKAALQNNGFNQANTEISFSYQDPATDSVALDVSSGEIARDRNGLPLLRKAGHGALLPNLSELDADGFWLQNVDNVLYDNPQVKSVVVTYKRALAALALELEQKSHKYIERLLEPDTSKCDLNIEAYFFIKNQLQTTIDPNWLNSVNEHELAKGLASILDRPILVAGFVPLEPGQAGGGPFFVDMKFNNIPVTSATIIEQAEFSGGAKNSTFQSGEYFNPVMLFVTRKRHDNSRFHLEDFIDSSRFFKSEKTDATGKPLYAYERPGLWNGSLAKANQVNVALPSCVFSAIKDLAGKESFLADLHQPYSGSPFKEIDSMRGVVTEDIKKYFS